MPGSVLLISPYKATELAQLSELALPTVSSPPGITTESKSDAAGDAVAIWNSAQVGPEAFRRHRDRRRRCFCAVLWVATMLALAAVAVLLFEIINAEEHVLVLENRKEFLARQNSSDRVTVKVESTTTRVITNKSTTPVSTPSTNSIFLPYTGTVPSLDKDLDYEAYDAPAAALPIPIGDGNATDIIYDYMYGTDIVSNHTDKAESPRVRRHARDVSVGRRFGRDLAKVQPMRNAVDKDSGRDRQEGDDSGSEERTSAGSIGDSLRRAIQLLKGVLSAKPSSRRPTARPRVERMPAESGDEGGDASGTDGRMTGKASETKDGKTLSATITDLPPNSTHRPDSLKLIDKPKASSAKLARITKAEYGISDKSQDSLNRDTFTIITDQKAAFEQRIAEDSAASGEDTSRQNNDMNSTPSSALNYAFSRKENKLIDTGLDYTSLFTVDVVNSTESMKGDDGQRQTPTPVQNFTNSGTKNDAEGNRPNSTSSPACTCTKSQGDRNDGPRTSPKYHSNASSISDATHLQSTSASMHTSTLESKASNAETVKSEETLSSSSAAENTKTTQSSVVQSTTFSGLGSEQPTRGAPAATSEQPTKDESLLPSEQTAGRKSTTKSEQPIGGGSTPTSETTKRGERTRTTPEELSLEESTTTSQQLTVATQETTTSTRNITRVEDSFKLASTPLDLQTNMTTMISGTHHDRATTSEQASTYFSTATEEPATEWVAGKRTERAQTTGKINVEGEIKKSAQTTGGELLPSSEQTVIEKMTTNSVSITKEHSTTLQEQSSQQLTTREQPAKSKSTIPYKNPTEGETTVSTELQSSSQKPMREQTQTSIQPSVITRDMASTREATRANDGLKTTSASFDQQQVETTRTVVTDRERISTSEREQMSTEPLTGEVVTGWSTREGTKKEHLTTPTIEKATRKGTSLTAEKTSWGESTSSSGQSTIAERKTTSDVQARDEQTTVREQITTTTQEIIGGERSTASAEDTFKVSSGTYAEQTATTAATMGEHADNGSAPELERASTKLWTGTDETVTKSGTREGTESRQWTVSTHEEESTPTHMSEGESITSDLLNKRESTPVSEQSAGGELTLTTDLSGEDLSPTSDWPKVVDSEGLTSVGDKTEEDYFRTASPYPSLDYQESVTTRVASTYQQQVSTLEVNRTSTELRTSTEESDVERSTRDKTERERPTTLTSKKTTEEMTTLERPTVKEPIDQELTPTSELPIGGELATSSKQAIGGTLSHTSEQPGTSGDESITSIIKTTRSDDRFGQITETDGLQTTAKTVSAHADQSSTSGLGQTSTELWIRTEEAATEPSIGEGTRNEEERTLTTKEVLIPVLEEVTGKSTAPHEQVTREDSTPTLERSTEGEVTTALEQLSEKERASLPREPAGQASTVIPDQPALDESTATNELSSTEELPSRSDWPTVIPITIYSNISSITRDTTRMEDTFSSTSAPSDDRMTTTARTASTYQGQGLTFVSDQTNTNLIGRTEGPVTEWVTRERTQKESRMTSAAREMTGEPTTLQQTDEETASSSVQSTTIEPTRIFTRPIKKSTPSFQHQTRQESTPMSVTGNKGGASATSEKSTMAKITPERSTKEKLTTFKQPAIGESTQSEKWLREETSPQQSVMSSHGVSINTRYTTQMDIGFGSTSAAFNQQTDMTTRTPIANNKRASTFDMEQTTTETWSKTREIVTGESVKETTGEHRTTQTLKSTTRSLTLEQSTGKKPTAVVQSTSGHATPTFERSTSSELTTLETPKGRESTVVSELPIRPSSLSTTDERNRVDLTLSTSHQPVTSTINLITNMGETTREDALGSTLASSDQQTTIMAATAGRHRERGSTVELEHTTTGAWNKPEEPVTGLSIGGRTNTEHPSTLTREKTTTEGTTTPAYEHPRGVEQTSPFMQPTSEASSPTSERTTKDDSTKFRQSTREGSVLAPKMETTDGRTRLPGQAPREKSTTASEKLISFSEITGSRRPTTGVEESFGPTLDTDSQSKTSTVKNVDTLRDRKSTSGVMQRSSESWTGTEEAVTELGSEESTERQPWSTRTVGRQSTPANEEIRGVSTSTSERFTSKESKQTFRQSPGLDEATTQEQTTEVKLPSLSEKPTRGDSTLTPQQSREEQTSTPNLPSGVESLSTLGQTTTVTGDIIISTKNGTRVEDGARSTQSSFERQTYTTTEALGTRHEMGSASELGRTTTYLWNSTEETVAELSAGEGTRNESSTTPTRYETPRESTRLEQSSDKEPTPAYAQSTRREPKSVSILSTSKETPQNPKQEAKESTPTSERPTREESIDTFEQLTATTKKIITSREVTTKAEDNITASKTFEQRTATATNTESTHHERDYTSALEWTSAMLSDGTEQAITGWNTGEGTERERGTVRTTREKPTVTLQESTSLLTKEITKGHTVSPPGEQTAQEPTSITDQPVKESSAPMSDQPTTGYEYATMEEPKSSPESVAREEPSSSPDQSARETQTSTFQKQTEGRGTTPHMNRTEEKSTQKYERTTRTETTMTPEQSTRDHSTLVSHHSTRKEPTLTSSQPTKGNLTPSCKMPSKVESTTSVHPTVKELTALEQHTMGEPTSSPETSSKEDTTQTLEQSTIKKSSVTFNNPVKKDSAQTSGQPAMGAGKTTGRRHTIVAGDSFRFTQAQVGWQTIMTERTSDAHHERDSTFESEQTTTWQESKTDETRTEWSTEKGTTGDQRTTLTPGVIREATTRQHPFDRNLTSPFHQLERGDTTPKSVLLITREPASKSKQPNRSESLTPGRSTKRGSIPTTEEPAKGEITPMPTSDRPSTSIGTSKVISLKDTTREDDLRSTYSQGDQQPTMSTRTAGTHYKRGPTVEPKYYTTVLWITTENTFMGLSTGGRAETEHPATATPWKEAAKEGPITTLAKQCGGDQRLPCLQSTGGNSESTPEQMNKDASTTMYEESTGESTSSSETETTASRTEVPEQVFEDKLTATSIPLTSTTQEMIMVGDSFESTSEKIDQSTATNVNTVNAYHEHGSTSGLERRSTEMSGTEETVTEGGGEERTEKEEGSAVTTGRQSTPTQREITRAESSSSLDQLTEERSMTTIKQSPEVKETTEHKLTTKIEPLHLVYDESTRADTTQTPQYPETGEPATIAEQSSREKVTASSHQSTIITGGMTIARNTTRAGDDYRSTAAPVDRQTVTTARAANAYRERDSTSEPEQTTTGAWARTDKLVTGEGTGKELWMSPTPEATKEPETLEQQTGKKIYSSVQPTRIGTSLEQPTRGGPTSTSDLTIIGAQTLTPNLTIQEEPAATYGPATISTEDMITGSRITAGVEDGFGLASTAFVQQITTTAGTFNTHHEQDSASSEIEQTTIELLVRTEEPVTEHNTGGKTETGLLTIMTGDKTTEKGTTLEWSGVGKTSSYAQSTKKGTKPTPEEVAKEKSVTYEQTTRGRLTLTPETETTENRTQTTEQVFREESVTAAERSPIATQEIFASTSVATTVEGSFRPATENIVGNKATTTSTVGAQHERESTPLQEQMSTDLWTGAKETFTKWDGAERTETEKWSTPTTGGWPSPTHKEMVGMESTSASHQLIGEESTPTTEMSLGAEATLAPDLSSKEEMSVFGKTTKEDSIQMPKQTADGESATTEPSSGENLTVTSGQLTRATGGIIIGERDTTRAEDGFRSTQVSLDKQTAATARTAVTYHEGGSTSELGQTTTELWSRVEGTRERTEKQLRATPTPEKTRDTTLEQTNRENPTSFAQSSGRGTTFFEQPAGEETRPTSEQPTGEQQAFTTEIATTERRTQTPKLAIEGESTVISKLSTTAGGDMISDNTNVTQVGDGFASTSVSIDGQTAITSRTASTYDGGSFTPEMDQTTTGPWSKAEGTVTGGSARETNNEQLRTTLSTEATGKTTLERTAGEAPASSSAQSNRGGTSFEHVPWEETRLTSEQPTGRQSTFTLETVTAEKRTSNMAITGEPTIELPTTTTRDMITDSRNISQVKGGSRTTSEPINWQTTVTSGTMGTYHEGDSTFEQRQITTELWSRAESTVIRDITRERTKKQPRTTLSPEPARETTLEQTTGAEPSSSSHSTRRGPASFEQPAGTETRPTSEQPTRGQPTLTRDLTITENRTQTSKLTFEGGSTMAPEPQTTITRDMITDSRDMTQVQHGSRSASEPIDLQTTMESRSTITYHEGGSMSEMEHTTEMWSRAEGTVAAGITRERTNKQLKTTSTPQLSSGAISEGPTSSAARPTKRGTSFQHPNWEEPGQKSEQPTKGQPKYTPEITTIEDRTQTPMLSIERESTTSSEVPTADVRDMLTDSINLTQVKDGFRSTSKLSDQQTTTISTAEGAYQRRDSTVAQGQTATEPWAKTEVKTTGWSIGEKTAKERLATSTADEVSGGLTTLGQPARTGPISSFEQSTGGGAASSPLHSTSRKPPASHNCNGKEPTTAPEQPTSRKLTSSFASTSTQPTREKSTRTTAKTAKTEPMPKTVSTAVAEPTADKTSYGTTERYTTTVKRTTRATTKATTDENSRERREKPKPLRPCFSGWIHWQSSCYKQFPWPVPWNYAVRFCRRRKADLASVHSDAENHFLMGRFGPVCSEGRCRAVTGLHIGLTDSAQEGRYLWTDGSAVDFLNWSGDQPSNSPPPYGDSDGEDCAELRVVFGFGQWNDISCTTVKRPFVCKAPAYEHLRRFGH